MNGNILFSEYNLKRCNIKSVELGHDSNRKYIIIENSLNN